MSEDDDRSSRDRLLRGREIADDPSSLVSLSGHFYRGEVDRTITWRQRLDQTTHWAVIVLAALLTWGFSGRDRPHYVLLLGMALMVVFLSIEAHRFREYDLWRRRVRLLQEHLFADAYAPGDDDAGWRNELAATLRRPSFDVRYGRALAHRLQRVYLPLLVVVLLAWVVRVTVFVAGEPWYRAASIPGLSGRAVVAGVALFYGATVGIALWFRGAAPLEFQE